MIEKARIAEESRDVNIFGIDQRQGCNSLGILSKNPKIPVGCNNNNNNYNDNNNNANANDNDDNLSFSDGTENHHPNDDEETKYHDKNDTTNQKNRHRPMFRIHSMNQPFPVQLVNTLSILECKKEQQEQYEQRDNENTRTKGEQ